MGQDKKTLGITRENAPILNELVANGNFGSELDAAKFAMAVAIEGGVPAGSAEGTETKWNIGSIDPDGSVRSLLRALYPSVSEPYRLLEYLINEGLQLLLRRGGKAVDVYEVLFTNRDRASPGGRGTPG